MNAALGVVVLAVASMQQNPAGMTTVAQGTNSAVEESRQAIARTAAEWQALWREHAGSEPAPAVDFAKEMVAAVFLGTRPTGGYGVEITAAVREGAALIVEYRERRPPRDALLSQALTAPFHIVRMPRHEEPVTFRATPAQPAR